MNLKKIKINQADYYIWLYFLYYLQGIIYPPGILNQLFLLVFFIWSIILGYKYLLKIKNQPIIIQMTVIIAWMYIVYGMINLLCPNNGKASPSHYLQYSLLSIIPIFALYNFFLKGKITNQKIIFYILPFLILNILQYFRLQSNLIQEALDVGSGVEEFTNNAGFLFVSLIPMILLIRNKKKKYLLLLISIFFIIISLKRGAILIGGLSFIYIILNDLKKSKGKQKVQMISLIILLSLVGSYKIIQFYNESPYFQQRVKNTENGNSSGRDRLYSKIWNSYKNGDILDISIGRGADSTVPVAGNYAHNDWLETLHNNGLFGALILICFYVAMIYDITKLKRFLSKTDIVAFYVLSFICITKTIFSMSIQNMPLTETLMIGYLCYLSKKRMQLTKNVVKLNIN